MARIKIPFSGVTTHSDHKDGECMTIVNMRPKNGVQKPVAPRKVLQTLSQEYDIEFVHKGAGYENWIGIKSESGYSTIYKDIKTTPLFIDEVHGVIHSIQQTKNTLSFITETTIYYALYKNNSYTFLGKLPELPPIQIKTSDKMATATAYYLTEYGETPVTGPDKSELDVQTRGLIYKAIDKLTEENGLHFTDGHFLRYAFRLYDGSLIKHSAPILILPVKDVLDLKMYVYGIDITEKVSSESRVEVNGYKIYVSYDFLSLSNWSDIITSIDFFLSDSLGLSNTENIKDLEWTGTVLKRTLTTVTPDSIKNVRNTSQFYYIKSARLVDSSILDPDPIPTKESEVSKIENLKYQELMTDDPFSHHTYGAESTYHYNNRIRLSGVQTTFFNGLSPELFMWFNTSLTDPTTGQPVTNYNGYKYADAPSALFNALMIEVEINTGTEIKKVYKTLSYGSWAIYKMFFSAFISYPDPRATRITVYRYLSDTSTWYRVFSTPLEKHNMLNIAYYLHDGLKPIWENTLPPTVTLPDTNIPVMLFEPDKLKVSEVNNPFVFPNENTYQIGSGRILNESSIVMNVNDRNYGMYPVFVFTSDGVFTMAGQNVEAVHASIQAPTYMEPPISGAICATPYGVMFITKRGLMIINQYKTEFISPQLREDDDYLNIDLTGIENPLVEYPTQSFTDYLQGVDLMMYNPYNDEVLIIDRDSDYNYVYDFPSKTFYMSTEKIDRAVQNVYPEMLVVGDTQLKDLKEAEGKATEVAIVTRPIEFGTTDVKKIDRAYLRGILRNVNNGSLADKMIVAVFHSLDGVNFVPTRGFKLNQNGNYKDFDMGMFARTKYRSYLFMIAGTMDDDSEIKYVEFETVKEYGNEKMR